MTSLNLRKPFFISKSVTDAFSACQKEGGSRRNWDFSFCFDRFDSKNKLGSVMVWMEGCFLCA